MDLRKISFYLEHQGEYIKNNPKHKESILYSTALNIHTVKKCSTRNPAFVLYAEKNLPFFTLCKTFDLFLILFHCFNYLMSVCVRAV